MLMIRGLISFSAVLMSGCAFADAVVDTNTKCHAGDGFVGEFGLVTRHFKPVIIEDRKPYRLNNNNHIVGIGYRYGDFTTSVSHFTNSYRRSSYMINLDYRLMSWSGVDVSIGGGLVSGYTPHIQQGFYLGRMMAVEELTVSPTVGLIRVCGLNITPKLRVMGVDVAMLDVEIS